MDRASNGWVTVDQSGLRAMSPQPGREQPGPGAARPRLGHESSLSPPSATAESRAGARPLPSRDDATRGWNGADVTLKRSAKGVELGPYRVRVRMVELVQDREGVVPGDPRGVARPGGEVGVPDVAEHLRLVVAIRTLVEQL
jgi:hypothetical protein